jgi:hypothetical protein
MRTASIFLSGLLLFGQSAQAQTVPTWANSSSRPSTPASGATGFNAQTGMYETYSNGQWAPQTPIGAVQGLGSGVSSALTNTIIGSGAVVAGQPQLLGSQASGGNRPTVADDDLHGEWPSMIYRSNGRSFMNISNGANQAVWQSLESLPRPLDVIGYYTEAAAINAGGTGYTQWDTITIEGGVTMAAASVVGGVLTPVTGCAGYISGTTLTVTTGCTGGVLAVGETITMAGVAAPAAGLPQGTYITAGSGASWTVNLSQTVGSSGSPVSFTASAVALQPVSTNITASITTQTVTVSAITTTGVPILVGGLISGAASTAGPYAGQNINSRGTGTGGTGTYGTNNSVTVTSETMGYTSPVTPIMTGACSPTTTAAPQLATSGSGSGATFNLTMLYPWGYGINLLTQCYSGNAYTVTNSQTGATKAISFLSDGFADIDTAFSFASSAQPIELCKFYYMCTYPLVTTWNDQGVNANNATGSYTNNVTLSAPMLLRDRIYGTNPRAVMINFNGSGNAPPQFEGPNQTYLTLPNGVALNSANMVQIMGGGLITTSLGVQTLNSNGGTVNAQMSDFACNNSNTAGNGNVGMNAWPTFTETPMVAACMYTNGYLQADSTFWPYPNAAIPGISGYNPSTLYGVTVGPGNNNSNCPLTSNVVTTYQPLSSDTYQSTILNLINQINNNTTLAAAGITARLDVFQGYAFDLFQPVGAACTITYTNMSDLRTTQRTGIGYAMQGGTLAYQSSGVDGNQFHAVDIIVPWALPLATVQMVRASIANQFDTDGHMGVLLIAGFASNVSGYHSPFAQDQMMWMSRNMKRNDVVISNRSVAGYLLSNIASQWTSNYTQFSRPMNYLTTGKPSNNILNLDMEYNGLTAAGNNTKEYAAIGTIAGYAASGNLTNLPSTAFATVCTTEVAKAVTATQLSEMLLLIADVQANPNGCGYLINLDSASYPVFSNQSGPWNWPYFVPSGGSHASPTSSAIIDSIIADLLNTIVR